MSVLTRLRTRIRRSSARSTRGLASFDGLTSLLGVAALGVATLAGVFFAPAANPSDDAAFLQGGTIYFTSGGTFEKADYPGLRAVRMGGEITLASDLPASFTPTKHGPPQGFIDSAAITSSVNPITSKTDIAGLSVTVDHPANRRIAVSFTGHVSSSEAGDVLFIYIDDSSGPVERVDTAIIRAGYAQYTNMKAVLTPPSGSETYQIAVRQFAESGNAGISAENVRPASIIVEDLGSSVPVLELLY